jgi:hypothetical protein
LWQQFLPHFPKANRFTLGSKIDELFLHAIEYCFLASYTREKEKLAFIDRCIVRVDLLKLMFQLGWDIEAVDSSKYGQMSDVLTDIGRMLGGWRRQTMQKLTPH